jgi:bifunctional non-homologous end joining protein LigD
VPVTGQIIEVRYLYAYPGGSLYQPVYLGRRDDLEREDCNLRQLKYRATVEEDEA